mgnify:CR=1 FL=1
MKKLKSFGSMGETLISALSLSLVATMAAAEVPPDYKKTIRHWKIEGNSFSGGFTCEATVNTTAGSVTVSRTFINGKGSSMLGIEAAGSIGVIPDEQAEMVLKSPNLYNNGKFFTKTSGSADVLMEFNRCIEVESNGE